jgi:hypothetical protein
VDDSVAEGNHSATITHTVASSDGNYDGLAVASVPVAITDNDTAGILITETAGSTDVSEAGQTDIYTVKLQSQPSSNVTIQIQTDGQVKTLPSTLTFTPSNWNQSQTIAVSAVNDLVAEGNHTGTISHLVSSSDLNYAGLTPANLIVNIADDDTAGLVITQSGEGTAVTEGGATDTYTVALSSQPTANVTVTMTAASDVSTSPVQLTFTPTNWSTPQTVTVSAIDDTLDEDTETVAINHTVASADPKYNGLPASPVWVQVTDNDEGAPTETLNIVGTAGADKLELVRGNVLTVRLNNQLVYEGTGVREVTFDGLGGYDEVNVTGAAEYEKVVLGPFTASLTGTNFSFTSTNIEHAVMESGGGNDLVEIYDSAGDDTVTGGPTQILIAGNGFSHQADNFYEAQIYAKYGGYDTLNLTDSAGKDKVKVERNDTVKLFNPSYLIRGKFFEEIKVTSTGGSDVARIWDTPADDTVTASYQEVVVTSGTNLDKPALLRQKATIQGFENASIFAAMGGHDVLTLLDSPGDDKAILRAHKAQMFPRTEANPYKYEIMGRDFDVVHAQSTTGVDVVRLHDTPDVDLLTAAYVEGKSFASLSRPLSATEMALMYDVRGFGDVNAVNDYGTSPKNRKNVDAAVDFLMLDEAHWDDI